MSTFNIEFDEDLEILESLLLRMVDVESQDADYNWCADYLDWNQLGARTWLEIGDCYTMMAEHILTIQQPYLWDNQYCPIEPP